MLIAQPARSQTLATGVLSGVVRNDAGAAIGNIAVRLSASDGSSPRSKVTARDGSFQFPLLAPGAYTVFVEEAGYLPKRIENIPIRTGEGLRLDIALTTARPPVVAAEIEQYRGNPIGSRPGSRQWLSSIPATALPWQRRELEDLAGLSTASTERLEVQGLPADQSTVLVDGVPYPLARHPDLEATHGRVALPLLAVASAELVTSDADAEWSGFSGGALSTHTRRGSSSFRAQGFGAWSGGPLSTFKYIPTDVPGHTSMWGGLLLSGPVLRDTANFVLGFEGRRVESPRPAPWDPEGFGAGVVSASGSAGGPDLSAYLRPYVLQTTIYSGFGRFDWSLGSDYALSVRAGVGGIVIGKADEVARAQEPGAVGVGSDLLISASLTSTLPWRELAHEIRVGLARGTRTYDRSLDEASAGSALPATDITTGALRLGADPKLAGRFQRTSWTLIQSVELQEQLHRIKAGVEAELSSHDDTYSYARGGQFFFAGSDELARGEGVFRQAAASLPAVTFSTYRYGAFLQDAWTPLPDLRVVGSVRFDVEKLPWEDVQPNVTWLQHSGMAESLIPPVQIMTVSPRLGLTWNVGGQGRLLVVASGGIFASPASPEAISELLQSDGTLTWRRTAGDVAYWPALPTAGQAPAATPRLVMLAPGFRGPITRRASFGLSRTLGAGTSLNLSSSYRDTDYLTRRTDLNLLTAPAARDQNGRTIHGPLIQSGELLSTSGPNRRFGDLERVFALNADGWSRYWDLTASLERDSGGALGLFARYTFSKTTDNWPARAGDGPDGQLSPFPADDGDDWREGVSDFDLPHRAAVGVEIRAGGSLAPTVSAVYRYRSGYPFTPGFGAGVDVNADGSDGNDPAWVDVNMPGIPELVAQWDCLRLQVGRFAERNACREASVHSVDVRVGMGFGGSGSLSAELFAEGLNLLDSNLGVPDPALYNIDPNGAVTPTAAGQVRLPLLANPGFGRRLSNVSDGRMIRIGLQVRY